MFASVVGSRGLASIQSPLSSNLGLVVTDHPPLPRPPHPNPTPQASAFLSVKLELLITAAAGNLGGWRGLRHAGSVSRVMPGTPVQMWQQVKRKGHLGGREGVAVGEGFL